MTSPLDKLHGFDQPPPPAWTPQTIGWYLVFAVVASALLWLAIHSMRKWHRNRYRREAFKQLAKLRTSEFSGLLKRTALSAWPREQVARLSGAEWLRFLNDSYRESNFLTSPGNRIEEVALRPAQLSAAEEQQLRSLAAKWIRSHHV